MTIKSLPSSSKKSHLQVFKDLDNFYWLGRDSNPRPKDYDSCVSRGIALILFSLFLAGLI